MKLSIKKKWLDLEYLWFYTIIFLIYVKLTISYLDVEISWWSKLEKEVANFEKFNFLGLPENFSGKMEFFIIPILFIYTTLYFNLLGRFKKTFIISISLLLLNIATFLLTNSSIIESIQSTLKLISPIFFFFAILIFFKKNQNDLKTVMFKMFKYCGLLVLIGILMFDNVISEMDDIRLPIYFGNIHSHSYILISIFIGTSYIVYDNKSLLKLLLFYSVTVLFLYFGYGVRTALIVYLTFIFANLFKRSAIFREIFVISIVFLPILGIIILFIIDFDIDAFASGRLSMYYAKYEMLKSYSIMEYAFGRGYGSDLIDIKRWAGERGSHSDFLTYLVENGIIYMLSFAFLILSLIPLTKKLNIIYASLIIGYLMSSFISNGIAIRPLAGYLYFMVLAYIYLSTYGSKYSSSIKKNNQL